MTADDPDLQFVSQFPVSTGQFGKSLLADVTGISYLALLLHYWRYGYREFPTRTRFLASLIPPVVVNAAILAGCWLLGYAWVYFVCWLVPMLLVLPVLLHLRGICEHGGHEADPNPMRCTWTVLNPVETFFIAPHNINYHMEHHGFPAVPQYNLPKLHRILAANGSLPAENVHRSYRTILRKLVTVQ